MADAFQAILPPSITSGWQAITGSRLGVESFRIEEVGFRVENYTG
jgi:hypothetical protein